MRLSSMVKFGHFNIIKRRVSEAKSFLPLYNSAVFNNSPLEDQLSSSEEAARRYKQLLGNIILSETGPFTRKVLVTRLEFNPDAEVLKVVSLRGRGLLTQEFSINNIIPITYPDMKISSPFPEPVLPAFLDGVMLYYNKFNQDFMLFEQDGEWKEETVNHPKLSLEARFNEREWQDNRTFM